MEHVRLFSNELNSVYECKLPLSRAKMSTITKQAIKSAKYYKHIVMLVEKFISKCGTEYKVPGLYVIDSIVRQSKHQNADKDVYGPRFSKNFEKTFLHLFQCPPDDRPKVIRVLNLWQKNEVFPPDIIQPLLSLAPDPGATLNQAPPIAPPTTKANKENSEESTGESSALDLDSANVIIQQQQAQIQALLQQQQQLQSQANTLLAPALQQALLTQQSEGGQIERLTSLIQQAQQLQQLQAMQHHQLVNNGTNPPVTVAATNKSHTSGGEFNTALLDDFDYSDDEDEDMEKRLARQRERLEKQETRLNKDNTSDQSSTNVLEQLQEQFRMQESAMAIANTNPPERSLPPKPPSTSLEHNPGPPNNILPVPPASNIPFQHHSGPPPVTHHAYPHPPPPLPPSHHHHPPPGPPRDWHRPPPHHPFPPPHFPPSPPHSRPRRFQSPPMPAMRGRSPSPPGRHPGMWRERNRWSPRRRSRSPPRRERKHSRSNSPPYLSSRRLVTPPLSAEERERQKKGIPPPKEKHVTVCSTTIWIGHLAKTVKQPQISSAFEEFGQVKSVDLVQARGCAYVVMVQRADAVRALNYLKDLRLNGNSCKLAWAPGRGVKGASFTGYWDLSTGTSVIPWDKITGQEVLNQLSEGGWIDPNTCPPGMTLPEPVNVEDNATPPVGVPPLADTLPPMPHPQTMVHPPVPMAVPPPPDGVLIGAHPVHPGGFVPPPVPFISSHPPRAAVPPHPIPPAVIPTTGPPPVEQPPARGEQDTISTNDDMQIDDSPSV